jgi:hypothetical protein
MTSIRLLFPALAALLAATAGQALDRPEVTFKVFQFPANQIPRIDGDASDWAMVPESYVVGSDQLVDDNKNYPAPDPQNLDVKVRVGWVKGLNRLYFLYEAYDNYWEFAQPGLRNDTFEIVVDGDASGGPLIDKGHREGWTPEEVGPVMSFDDPRISTQAANWAVQGVHAQNYHIFTPAEGKDWCMAWNAATWTKELPWANAAYRHELKPGGSGRLVLEFWITPFDYAGPEGPARAVESVLSENKIIGLGWVVIDYDDPAKKARSGFWTLSRNRRMYGNASRLTAFQLMPLEAQFRKPLEAQWSFQIVDHDRRLVAFKDESYGRITAWKWDFGDGTTSTEQHPIHAYKEWRPSYVVILDIEGPDGRARRSKVWDIQFK